LAFEDQNLPRMALLDWCSRVALVGQRGGADGSRPSGKVALMRRIPVLERSLPTTGRWAQEDRHLLGTSGNGQGTHALYDVPMKHTTTSKRRVGER
jgi:hypothetical protein